MHQIPKMDIEYVMVHQNPPPFDEKQWIGKGKIFPSNSSAFPDLEGYHKRKLFIPEDFYRYTFTNSKVAVKDFLALRDSDYQKKVMHWYIPQLRHASQPSLQMTMSNTLSQGLFHHKALLRQ
jgi:hypothetical protein